MPAAPELPYSARESSFEREVHALLLASLGALPPDLALILDQPLGHAIDVLTASAPVRRARLMVVSHGSSPEYVEDLWALKPGLLVTSLPSITELARLIRQMLDHGPLRQTPGLVCRLTSSERLLLQGVSHGHSNKVIANTLGLSDRTVHNALTRIFQKLGVTSRLEAALQYWGCSERPWPAQMKNT